MSIRAILFAAAVSVSPATTPELPPCPRDQLCEIVVTGTLDVSKLSPAERLERACGLTKILAENIRKQSHIKTLVGDAEVLGWIVCGQRNSN